jgi:threonine 3-dehydrogenase
VDLALNVATSTIADAQAELGMSEGFDVGMEMSGKPVAAQDMIANMAHGGRIAMLGLPAEEFPVDWSRIVTSMITIKGIYGREMYETWYQMTVMLQSGLDVSPVITHRFAFDDFRAGFAAAASGESGKVVLHWGSEG